LHPDYAGNNKKTEREFLELNEAYKRLIYESKYGTESYDKTDPRNDPRTREYWEIRKRTQSEEEINFEQVFNNKNRDKERALMRNCLIGLIISVFFGTIFPAIFLGEDTENFYRTGCQCDNCILGKLRSNPTLKLTRSSNTREREATKCLYLK